MQIREVELDRDVPGLVALVHETSPWTMRTEDSWLHRYSTTPASAQALLLVADVEGEVAGQVTASLDFFTGNSKALCAVAVRAAHRWRGIGSALYEAGEAHVRSLGASRVVAGFEENDLGVRFAEDRGFEVSRTDAISVLDPRTVTIPLSADIPLLPTTEVAPHVVHRIDVSTTVDMPFDGPIEEFEYDEWVSHVLEHPLFVPQGSYVAYADNEPAAVSLLIAELDVGRGANMFTGTLPQFRGRGLALAAKVATMRWAAANGITEIVANNDDTNAGMLAINRKLGYKPVARRVEYSKNL
jgi:GNAT superfamily N-acetyltransferase